MTAMDDLPTPRLPWWTRPSAANAWFLLPALLLVVAVGQSDFSGLAIRTNRFFGPDYIALCAGLILVSALGGWMGERIQPARSLRADTRVLGIAAGWLAVVILLAYLLWFRVFLQDPSLLLAMLAGDELPDRDVIGGLVTGITSLVNMGGVFFSLVGYLLFVERYRPRSLVVLTVVVYAMTLFRSYAWSERLALIEATIALAVPAVVALCARPPGGVLRCLLGLGPYLGLPFVFLYFALGEVFRAWTSSTYNTRMGFWEFSLGRFVSYYYTSFNNGAGMLETTAWPDASFQHVLQWLHRIPGAVDVLGSSEETMDLFLLRHADPEFNLPSSFLSVTYDLGIPGALLYFFASMFVAGLLYARYLRRDVLAVLVYPSVLVTLFESFRYTYWGTSRAVVWLFGALLVLGALWLAGALRGQEQEQ